MISNMATSVLEIVIQIKTAIQVCVFKVIHNVFDVAIHRRSLIITSRISIIVIDI